MKSKRSLCVIFVHSRPVINQVCIRTRETLTNNQTYWSVSIVIRHLQQNVGWNSILLLLTIPAKFSAPSVTSGLPLNHIWKSVFKEYTHKQKKGQNVELVLGQEILGPWGDTVWYTVGKNTSVTYAAKNTQEKSMLRATKTGIILESSFLAQSVITRQQWWQVSKPT